MHDTTFSEAADDFRPAERDRRHELTADLQLQSGVALMADADTSPTDRPNHPPLRRVDAAAYVRDTYGMPCSPRWLAKLAVVGGGPAFHKAGRIPLYPQAGLDAWAIDRLGGAHATTNDHQRARLTQSTLKRVHRRVVGDER